MYSYEERLKAVKLYLQYDKSYASVFRELGYPPSNGTLKLWFREYEQNGDLHKSFIKTSIYSDEQRKAAIQYYIEHGRSKSRTVKALGYPTRQQLTEWIKQDLAPWRGGLSLCWYAIVKVQSRKWGIAF